MNITVGIVEDNHDIRNALEQIIESADDCTLVCSCVNGEDALVQLPIHNPKVVLMDITLGGINGIEVVRELKTTCPEMLFMMCTIYEEDEKIFEALSAGASGYIIKKTTPPKMLDAIRELYEGGAPMSSQIARKVIGSFQQKNSIDDSRLLTQREKEILKLLARGLRYKEIAAELKISIDTVRTHTRHIYEKLQVQSRIEAINKVLGK